MKEKWNPILAIVLMIVFAITRWPGLLPENFSAAYGLAFCAGVYFGGAVAWVLPLATLFVSDILINVFCYGTAPVGWYMLGNYGAFAIVISLGRWFGARASWVKLLGGGLIGALIFYGITNTISWILDPLYPKTLGGWIQALTVGTPGWPHTWEFFRNTLLSGGLFTGLFAGAMKADAALEEKEEEEPETEGEEPAEAEA